MILSISCNCYINIVTIIVYLIILIEYRIFLKNNIFTEIEYYINYEICTLKISL